MSADQELVLFRAVSVLEAQQISRTGRFKSIPGALEGKFFAESLSDARRWGDAYYREADYEIVAVTLPRSVAEALRRWPRLDAIGPARNAELTELDSAAVPEGVAMKKARARIQWLTPEEGGRLSPFTGRRYSTVSRFDERSTEPEAWSLVVELQEPIDEHRCAVADVRFVVAEAPEELLHPGSRFALFEGSRKTAVGEVLA